MIPPHKDCHNWIYNYKIYDSLQVFNVGLINYVKFDYKGSISKWKVSLKLVLIFLDYFIFRKQYSKK